MKKFLTSEEAIELLPEGETVHTFYNGGIALIGADWEREDVIDKLKRSDKIEIAGEMAREMNHGLCVYNNDAKYQSDLLFIETDKVKLDAIDPLPEQEVLKAAGVESHSERETYDGCIRLIRQVVGYFQEYLDLIGIDQEGLPEEERFSIALSNFEIIQNLFLYGTNHSGGTSTRKKCKELGLDDSKYVEFRFRDDPNADDEDDV